jgi:hypothetical protein
MHSSMIQRFLQFQVRTVPTNHTMINLATMEAQLLAHLLNPNYWNSLQFNLYFCTHIAFKLKSML